MPDHSEYSLGKTFERDPAVQRSSARGGSNVRPRKAKEWVGTVFAL
ncbi:hypothetical protein [Jeotgalibacillus soli]|nr:hypothetical protein [Jeotgalibacillus soli]